MFSEASTCAGCSHKLAANGQLYTEGVGGIPKEKHDRVVKRFLAWYGNYPIRGEGVVGREMRKFWYFTVGFPSLLPREFLKTVFK